MLYTTALLDLEITAWIGDFLLPPLGGAFLLIQYGLLTLMIQRLQGAPKILEEVVSGLALPYCCGIEEVTGIELGEGRLVRTVILVVIIPGH